VKREGEREGRGGEGQKKDTAPPMEIPGYAADTSAVSAIDYHPEHFLFLLQFVYI
jgi:hypothetical protein